MSVSSVEEPGPPRSGTRTEPPVEVRRSARRRKTVTAFREAGRIVVVLPARMSGADERRWVQEMVARVVRREARAAPPASDASLARRADALATEHLDPWLGAAPRPTSVVWVQNQQQRWGSCTPSTGAIRLSSRLQRMPEWVVDYVIVHELGHLVHSRHDSAFWALVSRYPQTVQARGYLQGWADALAHGEQEPLPPDGLDVTD